MYDSDEPAEENSNSPSRVPLRRLLSFLALGALGAGLGTQQAIETHETNRYEVVEVAGGASRINPDANWDLANLDHERVDFWVRHYTVHNRGEFETLLKRSGRYRGMISQKLAEKGLPQDLLYLAMIESGFNPTAYSHAHASGLWQFMQPTGEVLGLDVNRAVDERNDPVKATDAALSHLSYLHKRFGSWYLAAASYNAGEGRIGRIMESETGQRSGSDRDYYRIWNELPKETRDYVPRMIAAARIAKDPAKYGFDHVEMEAPYTYDEVWVAPATPLEWVAEMAGVPMQEIQKLNPHLKLERTRNDEASTVRLPEGRAPLFLNRWMAERQAKAAKENKTPVRVAQSSATTSRRITR